ncbi:putative lipoprotein (fragment) [Tenacibaculum maritimum]
MGLKDSLPVGTLAEFKKKHPKILEDLLKNDSIHFRFPFPKRDKIRGLSEGVRVPVVY